MTLDSFFYLLGGCTMLVVALHIFLYVYPDIKKKFKSYKEKEPNIGLLYYTVDDNEEDYADYIKWAIDNDYEIYFDKYVMEDSFISSNK